MQQLCERRITNTPRDIPHVLGNCGLNRSSTCASLNSPEGRDSETGFFKTSHNNSDAALTRRETEKGGFMLAFVLNIHNKPLMPCHAGKARLLLKTGKAEVIKRTPFVIRLLHGSSGYKQPLTLGIDSGYENVGLSVISEQKELYSAEVRLRSDIVKLNSERRTYRRSRRNRKTWYRQPRFLNRKKRDGWLAPSIQHKLDSQAKLVESIGKILPFKKVSVEVAAFDIQKIKNPDITGTDYQNGPQKDFWNTREYVLYRDNHTCQHCKSKSKDRVLEVHHIISRQMGGDRPDNLITLCETCHDKVSKGKIKLNVGPSKGSKVETFMTMVRRRLVNELRKRGYDVVHTYGYITKGERIALGLAKSHIDDAFVIAGGNDQVRSVDQHFLRQVRKCNRKLYKGDRSHIKNTAPRLVKGFQRFDKVRFKNTECLIFGRWLTGYFDLRKLGGTKVHSSASAKQLTLLERAKTLLIERRQVAFAPIP